MRAYQMVVFTNCKPGTEAEFNKWYDEIHIPEVIAMPGFTGATRGRITMPEGSKPRFGYVAFYSILTDDIGATIGAVRKRVADRSFTQSDTLDVDREMLISEQLVPGEPA